MLLLVMVSTTAMESKLEQECILIFIFWIFFIASNFGGGRWIDFVAP